MRTDSDQSQSNFYSKYLVHVWQEDTALSVAHLRQCGACVCELCTSQAVGGCATETLCVFVQLWLFGYELTDTLCVFCEKEVHILTSKKKVDFLQPVLPLLEEEPDMPTVRMHLRTKVRRSDGHCLVLCYRAHLHRHCWSGLSLLCCNLFCWRWQL